MRRRYCTGRTASILALSTLLALGGCAAKKTITGVPAGVPVSAVQSCDQATQQLATIAKVTTELRTTVIGLNKTTFVNAAGQPEAIFPDGPQYVDALNVIGKIDQLQIEAANILNAQPQNWTASTQSQIATLVQQMGQALGQLTADGTLGIKNPTKQAQVQQLITELTSAASLIVSLT